MTIEPPPTPRINHPANGWYPDSTGRLRWWNENGWSETYQQPIVAVVAPREQADPTNHVFHLIMTLVTLGLWAPVWLVLAMGRLVAFDVRQMKRKKEAREQALHAQAQQEVAE